MVKEEEIRLVGEVIKENAVNKIQEAVGDDILKNNDFRHSKIHPDLAEEIKYTFEKKKIPYVYSPELNRILYRTKDENKVVKTINKINKKHLFNYTQYISSDELIDMTVTDEYAQGKLFTLSNLSEYELDFLKRKLENMAPDLSIAVENTSLENGPASYSIVLPADLVFSDNPNTPDLCSAYLDMCLNLYGPNTEEYATLIDTEKKINNLQNEIFNKAQTNPIYIISGINPKKDYIKLDNKEMTKIKNGKTQYKISRFDDKFKASFYKELDSIPLKKILNESSLEKWEQSLDKSKESKIEQIKNFIEKKYLGDNIVDNINYAIKEKFKNNDIKITNPTNQFSYFNEEAKKIINACLKTPSELVTVGKEEGFTDKSIGKIKKNITSTSFNKSDFEYVNNIYGKHGFYYDDLTEQISAYKEAKQKQQQLLDGDMPRQGKKISEDSMD